MSTPAAVELAEFKEHLNKAATEDDDELTAFIVSATSIAERDADCGIGPIVKRDITRRVDIDCGRGMLPLSPAVAVVTATQVDTGDVVTVTDLDPDLSIITTDATGPLSVTYTVGRATGVADVDEDIRKAVCIIGKHLWETQRGRSASARGGTLGQDSTPDERVPSGFLIPHRARSILLGHRAWARVM